MAYSKAENKLVKLKILNSYHTMLLPDGGGVFNEWFLSRQIDAYQNLQIMNE